MGAISQAMDKPLKPHKAKIQFDGVTITLPMPLFLVIEDVGWWQGVDGSSHQEPYRSNMGRCHCLEDYQALTHLAERLSMRIALGMVMCEWDRTDFLKNVSGATWMGKAWNNQINRGQQLDETSDFLNNHKHLLEIALHGVGHEFWNDGHMERSEFHDKNGNMRSKGVVTSHFEAFERLLEQNCIHGFPRLFIPPALNHSYGDSSMQTLIKGFGIDYVTTTFSSARCFKTPQHPKLTWEAGVILLERGSPSVAWDKIASSPAWNGPQPIFPLHWGNLLHFQPERNIEIVDMWADMLLLKTAGPDVILSEDAAACWRQAGMYYLAEMKKEKDSVIIDLSELPKLSSVSGFFSIKIQGRPDWGWACTGADIIESKQESDNILILKLLPEKGKEKVVIFPVESNKKNALSGSMIF